MKRLIGLIDDIYHKYAHDYFEFFFSNEGVNREGINFEFFCISQFGFKFLNTFVIRLCLSGSGEVQMTRLGIYDASYVVNGIYVKKWLKMNK